ncbi:3-deoxy-D-manno-octulosonic-acid transferase [Cognatiyoonia sediminum]|uniref:3-deoxy-D-manno-octulosonic acid transferase n=1 Tax=Cognatiyoonia sediminum TaxID=1508389 RepID=A0A1M5RCE8_9RHOB|nr:glycosyltransferase N-terminal domain-containing protein [Cognatiyoonia sediminum]SHH23473.1 3-deoxy-D-manno-octulosonic-acid transferase [Cognatiyoonia sediminum]
MSSDRFAIWVRCNDATKLPVLLELEEALQEDGYPVWFEVTLPNSAGTSMGHPVRSKDVARFLDDLEPRALFWVGGQFDPTTLAAALARNINVVVADAGIAMLPRMGRGWFPGKTRALLSQFSHVFARTSESAEGLTRAGVREDRITASGPLQSSGDVLPHDEEQRHELSQRLGPRPMWVAAHVGEAEVNTLAAAQREASKRAHRLLGIVIPSDNPDGIAHLLRSASFAVTVESDGEMPTESTQFHVASGCETAGLWFRMAPLTVIGGSFDEGARIDPFSAATVGSVSIHGSHYGNFANHFEQLVDANASVICNSPKDLGSAISVMLSADRAAHCARNGWEVTSRGADVMNQIRSHLGSILDA